MLANQTVHEPKPFSESNAPYKQSMEGTQSGQKESFPLAYSWSPGWNSNQSNHKFRDEYRGSELTQQSGVPCFVAPTGVQWFKWQATWSKSVKAQWQILPLQKVFGSDTLSLHALPIAQLSVPAHIVMSHADAKKLGVEKGQLLYCDDNATALQLMISARVPSQTLLVYVPANQLFDMQHCSSLTRATDKQVKAYQAQQVKLQTQQQTQKQQQLDRLLNQDQTIPIHFVEGVV